MKTSLKTYVVIWFIAALAFLGIICSIGGKGLNAFTGPRASLYLFAFASLIIQLAVGIFIFGKKEDDRRSSSGFYGIPLGYFASAMTIVTLLLSILLAVRIDIPIWVGTIIVIVVLAIDLTVSVALGGFSRQAPKADEQVKRATSLFMVLRARSEALVARQTNSEIAASTKRVCEALRYSDPVSSPVIADADQGVLTAYEAYEDAVNRAYVNSDEGSLTALNVAEMSLNSRLSERNALCKLNKVR